MNPDVEMLASRLASRLEINQKNLIQGEDWLAILQVVMFLVNALKECRKEPVEAYDFISGKEWFAFSGLRIRRAARQAKGERLRRIESNRFASVVEEETRLLTLKDIVKIYV